MNQKIPFSIIPFNLLKNISKPFGIISRKLEKLFPSLKFYLESAEIKIDPVVYINMSLMATFIFYIFITLMLSTLLFIFEIKNYAISFVIAIPLSIFVLIQQLIYPRILSHRKIRNIERNLLPALQHILINLNSSVPLFNTLVSIAAEDFGEISKEFKKAIKKINAGEPQLDVLNKMADNNPS